VKSLVRWILSGVPNAQAVKTRSLEFIVHSDRANWQLKALLVSIEPRQATEAFG
jgi:hypothetical protein